MDDNLTILGLGIETTDDRQTVRLRGGILHPIYMGDKSIRPVPFSKGWYQIDINASGILVPWWLLIAGLMIWPERRLMELWKRALIGVPLMLLFTFELPLELLGNFQASVFRMAGAFDTGILLIWDRFLEGGGATALALALAVIAISVADRCTDQRTSEEVLVTQLP